MGQYMTMLGPATCPTVLRQLEPGSAAARDQARGQPGARRLAHLIERPLWDRYERRLLEQMSAVVALTVRDAESMRELAPAARIVRIPLGTEIPTRAADPLGGSPPSLLFTGNFVHPPNVSAATRLANTILPLVRAVVPDAELRVVGPAPPAALRGRTREGIFALGEVPDLWPFLDAASLVVAPLHEGGGMRVKVAEALAAGKAVVASGRAVEGLAVASGDQLLLAETDDAVAAACVRLLRSSEVRAGLARRARAWAERHLGWDAPVTAFEQLYASLRD
jgi:glycosyltransferase involved in cell wall biosynthesis